MAPHRSDVFGKFERRLSHMPYVSHDIFAESVTIGLFFFFVLLAFLLRFFVQIKNVH